jgi:Tripartite tricarboxylate transporter TctB family
MQLEQRAGLLALGRYSRDYYGGGLMLLVGGSAIYKGLNYQVGTLTRMGPGYFPVAVGAVLAAMGVLILLGARRQVPAGAARRRPPEWRGWLCIILASIAFVVLGHYGGMVPATFGVVFIAALGDRQNSFRSALLLAVAMVAVSVIVFSWALQLQLPLFRWG